MHRTLVLEIRTLLHRTLVLEIRTVSYLFIHYLLTFVRYLYWQSLFLDETIQATYLFAVILLVFVVTNFGLGCRSIDRVCEQRTLRVGLRLLD